MAGYGYGWAPVGAPSATMQQEAQTQQQRQQHLRDEQQSLRDFDNSVNAVSFGFVATAILISMFLVMAIFERFLRPASPDLSPSARGSHPDLEAQLSFHPKLGRSSPKMTVYARGVSVLMPGEEIPTYIAHPAPVPCPYERVAWPQHPPPGLASPANPVSHTNSNPQQMLDVT